VNLSVRIFIGFFVLTGFAIWLAMRSFTAELVPGMRQSMEEMLVDTANLMAELVAEEVIQGTLQTGQFNRAMSAFEQRRFEARIWFLKKRDPNLIIYITDAKGMVIYDSRHLDLGKDYSQWNDIYNTLRGKYGARTTRADPDDEFSSIMYVAAPIKNKHEIIGVVTVGKPSVAVQPFVERAKQNIQEKGGLVILGALAIGLMITYWLTFSIRKLTTYALAVRDGKRVAPPKLGEKELAQLADAMDAMRRELEGKDYVEQYLHSLTHELKTPLAAIQGTAELLEEDMPAKDRQHFIANIRGQAERLHQVVEQLLRLASIEKQQGLRNPELVQVDELMRDLWQERHWRIQQKDIKLNDAKLQPVRLTAERFLLQQAIGNLLDNAIEFSPKGSTINLQSFDKDGYLILTVADKGPGIPDFALARVFERFYTLSQSPDGSSSSGLGLSFVYEVAQLHGGTIELENLEQGGAMATLSLPLKPELSIS
jgi:two-component system, OmpR family, sensor histidine kinase CreC